ncbi:MAG TPA: YgeY family selenium metabolism-linked hydrolase [Cytophagales bacterium]|nr:YgeY family selenium metabolism-linked hydrolase [Cytophagales bacterium]
MNPAQQKELIEFTQQLVRTRSYTGEEGAIIQLVAERMTALGFDEVKVDAMGNVLGRVGRGGSSLLFDSHVDTVQVNDAAMWQYDPFGGEIVNGVLHGRGSVDMKSSVAANVYAAAWAKQQGLVEDKTVYVSCTVMEEDCDGENLKHLFREFSLRPDAVVICEPSNNRIALGHKGKVQVSIKTQGISAHGAAPEKGVNAIYEMAEIIQRVDRLNARLLTQANPRGTVVMSDIRSTSASLNAVPSACEAYLDRRLVPGETEEQIKAEMDSLIAGKRASWEVGELHRTSYTGLPVRYRPFHLAWKMDVEHPLTHVCLAAYAKAFGRQQEAFEFWDFSTNAVTPGSLGIPTIGFGPGDYKLAHMRDEHLPTLEIIKAASFYVELIRAF